MTLPKEFPHSNEISFLHCAINIFCLMSTNNVYDFYFANKIDR